MNEKVFGEPISPGIGSGEVWHWRIAFSAVQTNFTDAAALAKQSLQPFQSSEFFSLYMGMLSDPMLKKLVEDGQQNGLSFEAAVREAQQTITKVVAAAGGDSYIAARADDVAKVCDLLLRSETPVTVPPGKVAVADHLTLTQILSLPRSRLAGLVIGNTGINSHLALLARGAGIPTVGGIDAPCKLFPEGVNVIVDGNSGSIKEGRDIAKKPDKFTTGAVSTACGIEITLLANVESSWQVAQLGGTRAVGLYRTEFEAIATREFPSRKRWEKIAKDVLAETSDVAFRLYDIGADKQLNHGAVNEQNPALGRRAHRRWSEETYWSHAKAQALGLLAATQHSEVRITLPFVADTEEAVYVKSAIENLGNEVPGFRAENLRFGVMLELPSVLCDIKNLDQQFDYFSVGTNDLLQYLYATDRERREDSFSSVCRPSALRFLHALLQPITIPITVCGNAGSDALQLKALIAIGYRRFSVPAGIGASIRKIVSEISIPKELGKNLLSTVTKAEVSELLV